MFLKDMLKEELANSRRIKADVEAALRKLPPGALVRKKVGGRVYCYLAERKAGKVVFAYLGKLAAGEIRRYEATAEIVMGRGPKPAGDPRAFDAREIAARLGPTAPRPL